MKCRVCGIETDVHYRAKKRQSLCDVCNRETPNKIELLAFNARYWGKKFPDIPFGTL